ncbi:galactokinase [Haloferax sp. DFSO60]|uniref:galactokinase n=1 Tax=Haloferax sp. DFSO60 TaxID=3388652 RepID=UPI0039780E86
MEFDLDLRAKSALADVFGDGPDPVVAVAPGRVNLVGGHTDYNDGFCLPVAVNRYVAVAARERDDDIIAAHALDFDQTRTIEPGGSPDGWAAYVAAVANVLRETESIPGVELAITSNLPTGAGLSSSAALELAVATVLTELAGVDISRRDLALACWRAEREGVGVECGILDQFAVALCEPDSALFLDCQTRASEHVSLGDGDVGLLVLDTGVSHALADSGYNDRVRECHSAVSALSDAAGRDFASLREVTTDVLEQHRDALTPTEYRRARHVLSENARVQRARDALAVGDYDAVGSAIVESHESLRDDYEVSCEELDDAVALATAVDGVYGARMTGGGFGGSAVALVDGAALERVKNEIRAEITERVGPDARVFACRPSGGVRLE